MFPHRHAIWGPTVHFVSHPADSFMHALFEQRVTRSRSNPSISKRLRRSAWWKTCSSCKKWEVSQSAGLANRNEKRWDIFSKSELQSFYSVHSCSIALSCYIKIHYLNYLVYIVVELKLCVHFAHRALFWNNSQTHCLHGFTWCSWWALSFCVTQMWVSDSVTQDPSNQTSSRPSSGRQVRLE